MYKSKLCNAIQNKGWHEEHTSQHSSQETGKTDKELAKSDLSMEFGLFEAILYQKSCFVLTMWEPLVSQSPMLTSQYVNVGAVIQIQTHCCHL